MSPTCSREVIQLKNHHPINVSYTAIPPTFIFFMTIIPEPCVVSSFSPPEIICFVSCCRCGIHHGPPMTSCFLSTSAHYPRSWLRNNPFNALTLAYINDKFLASNDRMTSLAFEWKTLYGVQHQNIHSQHGKCTTIPWESLPLLVISLMSINELHHWLVIRRCLPMFDFRTHIRMVKLVLELTIEWVRRPLI